MWLSSNNSDLIYGRPGKVLNGPRIGSAVGHVARIEGSLDLRSCNVNMEADSCSGPRSSVWDARDPPSCCLMQYRDRPHALQSNAFAFGKREIVFCSCKNLLPLNFLKIFLILWSLTFNKLDIFNNARYRFDSRFIAGIVRLF